MAAESATITATHGKPRARPHGAKTQELYEEGENGKRGSTITFESAGVLFKKLFSRVRFQKGYKSNPKIWIMKENVSLGKLEVPHNESYVWQRQGICFNIIALKNVKRLCQGLMSGGPSQRDAAGCHGHGKKNAALVGLVSSPLGRAKLCCICI